MTDLTTTYLGLRLHSPLVASPGPVTGDPSGFGLTETDAARAISWFMSSSVTSILAFLHACSIILRLIIPSSDSLP